MADHDDALGLLIHSLARADTLDALPQVVDVVREAPLNPPEAIQAQFVGSSYVTAYAEAASFVRVADKWLKEHSKQTLSSVGNVVDFGSGWGRISRMLLAHVALPSADIRCRRGR